MSIIEAIKRAETEHAVYALLTAYIESLWDEATGSGLRARLHKLPIDGQIDVRERAMALTSQDVTSAGPIVAEAAEIFRVASERLGVSER